MADCQGQSPEIQQFAGSITGCTATGTAIVQYADALSAQVAKREITDAEAMRRFIEFKTAQLNANRQASAMAAASRPKVCNTPSGTTTTFCY